VVNLPPGIAPGNYTLNVQITDKGKGDFDESVVTIGAGPSLAGIPCDTGTVDKPNGHTTVSVAANTGIITLRCESSNPVLGVFLGAGPLECTSFGGITVCFLQRYSVMEVDAAGTPVVNGFACPAILNQSAFPALCGETQRFATGATVRLGT